MKKLSKIFAVLIVVAICITTIPKQGVYANSKSSMSEAEIDSKVKELVSSMTIEQKLTQMMIMSFQDDAGYTTKLTSPYKNLLKKYDFGGIILYSKNMTGMEQTITLIRDSQKASMSSENGIPMFVCVDQEGGWINRVSYGVIGSGNMALGAADDTGLTTEIADIMGQEIKALGFNMDFAPVADVNNNPDNPVIGIRSFSDDPEMVAKHVNAFIAGLAKNNVSAAVKHFPGHGDVGEDSHTHLPLSELTLEQMRKCELIPFIEGIDSGIDMIMTAHIQYPNVEKNTYVSKLDGENVYLPATLSKTIMTGLLREELGYDGIIITDSLLMDAIANHFDETDAAVMAINAGVDILLRPIDIYNDGEVNTFVRVEDYINKLVKRVKSGDIKEAELDDSVERILKLKYKNGIMTETLSVSKKKKLKQAKKVVGSAEHREREWDIATKGLTLVKNESSILPIDGNNGNKTLVLIPTEYRRDSVEYAKTRLEKEGLLDASKVSVICYEDLKINNKKLQKALKKAKNVIILSQATAKNDLIDQVIEQAHTQKNCKVTLLSLNLPYDVACYEDADAVICAYHPYGSAYDEEGNGPFNLNLVAAFCSVFGECVPEGTLPVNIPKITVNEDGTIAYSKELLYERGYGISLCSDDPDETPSVWEEIIDDHTSINEYTDVQYVVYLGTNDKDTNEPVFSHEEAKEKAKEILLKHFGGYTIMEADGGWIDGDTVYKEYTLVIFISYTNEEDVHKAADEMIKVFNQSSVLIQANPTKNEYYGG